MKVNLSETDEVSLGERVSRNTVYEMNKIQKEEAVSLTEQSCQRVSAVPS